MRASPRPIRSRSPPIRRCRKSARRWSERARAHFEKADEVMARNPRRVVRAPRIMSKYYRAILELLVARGFATPRTAGSPQQDGPYRHSAPLRIHLMQKTVHIIGAGISGLSAAVRLANANFKVHVHEATQQAGGRCRSYFDAATNLTIDNGNHLLLSGNHHAVAYARSIGTEAGLVGPKRAQFPFVDLTTGQRWQLDLGDSRLPLVGVRCGAACPRYGSARLSGADASDLGSAAQAGRRRHPLQGDAVSAAGAAAACWRRSTSILPRDRRALPARWCGRRCWRADRLAGR